MREPKRAALIRLSLLLAAVLPAARGGQPVAGKGVVSLQAVEAVPIIVHRVDAGVVRPEQVAAELKVIGRIREDEIDRIRRQRLHHLDAIALNHPIERQRRPG